MEGKIPNATLDMLEAACNEASPAPWVVSGIGGGCRINGLPTRKEREGYPIVRGAGGYRRREDADFSALARAWMPELIKLVRHLQAGIIVAILLLALSLPAMAAQYDYGCASYYGHGDGYAWQKTANGELMDPQAMATASNHYPLGTRLRVTNRANGKTIEVRVNDTGGRRLLDLSYGAFCKIANPSTGVIRVRVQVVP